MRRYFEDYRNYIQYGEEIIECDSLEKLLEFLKHSEKFKELIWNTLIKVQKTKKYINIKEVLLQEIKFPTNLRGLNLIKPEDFAFTRLMNFIESSYCNILITSNSVQYSDILNVQYTIKTIEQYITEKNLVNFTSQQYASSKRLENTFKKELPFFKTYIDIILEKQK